MNECIIGASSDHNISRMLSFSWTNRDGGAGEEDEEKDDDDVGDDDDDDDDGDDSAGDVERGAVNNDESLPCSRMLTRKKVMIMAKARLP